MNGHKNLSGELYGQISKIPAYIFELFIGVDDFKGIRITKSFDLPYYYLGCANYVNIGLQRPS